MNLRQLLVASLSAVWLAAYPAASSAVAAPTTASPPVSTEAASSLLLQAVDFQRRGDYPSAIDAYTNALKGPLSLKMRITALYNRAVAYQQSGQVALAIEDFNNALLLHPELSHAYYGRANAMRQAGNHPGALADYQRAAQHKYPHAHLPLFGQALTYESMNRPLSAEKLLQGTLQLRPDFAPAKEKLAELRRIAPETAKVESEAEARISVAVDTESVYGTMTKRIDQIVVSSVSPVPADQVVRKTFVSKPVRPPLRLLDAAAQVNVATVTLPERRSLSLSQTPGSIAPGFIVSEKNRTPKLQDRIPQEMHEQVASTDLLIEPVSAPVEFRTRTLEPTPSVTLSTEQAENHESEGFLIQINSQRSEEAAWAAWSKLKRKHGKLLADKEAIVQKADLGSEGIVYRLRIKGLSTKAQANEFCGKLKSAGLACFVAKASA